MSSDCTVPIKSEKDIVLARKEVRAVSQALGFGLTDVTRVVTAASELARNVIRYAVEGEVVIRRISENGRTGIEMVFADKGPGIPDVVLAMTEGYSTERSLGMGLPGARKLMDEMTIDSRVGEGTTVTIRKWKR